MDSDRIDREGKIPAAVIDGLRELGAFGIKIPKEYGGLGLSQTTYTHAIGLVTSVDGNLTALLSAHSRSACRSRSSSSARRSRRQKYLPRLAKGAISAFALTEVERRLRPRGDEHDARCSRPTARHYILNGEKLWCTNGTSAELIVVMARTGPEEDHGIHRGDELARASRSCIAPLHGPQGDRERHHPLHQREGSGREHALGRGQGLKLALITLNTGRLTLPASAAAGGKRCLEIARRWAAERVQWGQPIGKHEAVAQKIGRMAADHFAMEAVADLASLWPIAADADIRLEAAMAKMWNTEVGWRIVDDTLQIRGGRGYETADSLRSRGERPDPDRADDARLPHQPDLRGLERDHAAVHRARGGGHAPQDRRRARSIRRRPAREKLRTLGSSRACSTPRWYPRLWFGLRGRFGLWRVRARWRRTSASWIGRSRRLARTLFHCMVRFGPKLEKRQAVLCRLVDIGAELLAMSAACSRAHAMVKDDPENRGPVELADLFSRHARRRVEERFAAVFDNDDVATYRVAQSVLDGEHTWLEAGMVRHIPPVDPLDNSSVVR